MSEVWNPNPNAAVNVLGRTPGALRDYGERAAAYFHEDDGGIESLGMQRRCVAVPNPARARIVSGAVYLDRFEPVCRVQVIGRSE